MTVATPVLSPAPLTAEQLHAEVIDYLAECGAVGGYAAQSEQASEPTAWASIALAAAGCTRQASRGAEWLAERQAADGSVGVTLSQHDPGWPTGLAMLAWQAVDPEAHRSRIERAAQWALRQEPWQGTPSPTFGHDVTLQGWSWAPNTHSWIEPTVFFGVALRRAGYAEHDRCRQAMRLLIDRLLPSGGVNYGNTIVLGQELLQHVQPSGLVAWALAEESINDPRWERLLAYLRQASLRPTGAASLALATIGLASNGLATDRLSRPLSRAWTRARSEGGVYKPALIALALEGLLRNADPTRSEA